MPSTVEIDQINTSFATNLKYIKIVSSQPGAQAGGTNSIAIGGNSIANGDNSLAIGSGATTNFSNSIALGVNSVADEANTVSVGARTQEKRITNVANGISLTDAATVGQLDALQAQLTASTSGGAKSMMQTPSAVLSYIAVSSNTTQGTMTTASEDLNAMAIGPAAAATGLSALAVGGRAAAGSNFSTAVGSGAGALSNNSTVIGASATVAATSDNSVSIGYNSRAGGDNNGSFNTLAVGAYASAISAGSVAIGYGSIVAAGATNGMALGLNSTVTSANGVAIGYGAVANRANVVSVGNATRQSQIINVAAGTSSTDAVNVSQLSSMAAAIGGGAAVNPDGTVKRPSFTIGGETYSDVGSALAASAGNSVQYDTSEHAAPDAGRCRRYKSRSSLSNVANATSSTDAVNLSQLQSMGMTVDSNGNVVNSFVAYDDSTKTKLTFGGVGAAEPVKLSNVANATSSTDAGNLSQLQSMGMTVDSNGNVVNSFVAYDDSTEDQAHAGRCSARRSRSELANVANATSSTDAVNLSQLQSMGMTVDSNGNVVNSFVAYDDSTKTKLTFGGVGAVQSRSSWSNVANADEQHGRGEPVAAAIDGHDGRLERQRGELVRRL